MLGPFGHALVFLVSSRTRKNACDVGFILWRRRVELRQRATIAWPGEGREGGRGAASKRFSETEGFFGAAQPDVMNGHWAFVKHHHWL